jgi:chemotaxis protein histidine kinase CheA
MAIKKAATKAAPAKAPTPQYKKGDRIVFNGYGPDVEEADQVLVAGEIYEVADVQDDERVVVETDNPDYNPKKKQSEANPKRILADAYFEEVSPAPEEDGEEVDDDDDDDDGEEVVDDDGDDDEPEEVVEEKKPARSVAAKTTTAKTVTKAAAPATAKATATKAAPATAKTTAAKPAAKTTAQAKAGTKAGTKAAPAKAKVALAKKAEPEIDPDLQPLDHEDEDILALVAESEDLLALAQDLVEDSSSIEYRLGGVLHHIRISGAYKALDPRYAENAGFALYAEETLSCGYRKARYLINIYRAFCKCGIDGSKVQELGWTKCAKISAVMTEENAEELVELASTHSVTELVDNIKTSYVKAGEGGETTPRAKKVTFKFGLLQDSATGVQEILLNTQKRLGLKSLDLVFEHIVMEWAAEHSPSQSKAARRAGNATRPKAAAAAAAA